MFRLLKYLKAYKFALLMVVVLTAVRVLATLALPDYMADIINKGIIGNDQHLIWLNGGIMTFVTLLSGVATVGAGYFAAKTATGFATDLRYKVFTKVENFSKLELDKFSTASLITRTTNDIQQIQQVMVLMLTLVLMAPMMGIGAIIKGLHLAPSMSWIIILAVVTIIVVISCFFAAAVPKFKIMQKMVDKLNLVTRENLTGLRVIRAFNREKYQEDKFDQTNRQLTSVTLYVNRLMSGLQPSMFFIFNAISILIIWVGAHYVQSGSLQIGSMIAFMQYALLILTSFMMISFIFILVPRAAVSGQRIQEVLQTKSQINDPAKPVLLQAGQSMAVEFKDVSFSYAGAQEKVLHNISFKAEPGQLTAIVGSTGSGKSTLVNLVPRFYDATDGQVLVGGVDVRRLRQADLRENVGYVAQKSVLFSGTVASNIAYGRPSADPTEIKQAAKVAQADHFINNLDGKYQAAISQDGGNVSGGQRQRLAIARALLKKPAVYLFDDSF
ncbi:MAG: ABC transporter ATP-binding protein, partial [Candidatus Saccharimonadales bacterium]